MASLSHLLNGHAIEPAAEQPPMTRIDQADSGAKRSPLLVRFPVADQPSGDTNRRSSRNTRAKRYGEDDDEGYDSSFSAMDVEPVVQRPFLPNLDEIDENELLSREARIWTQPLQTYIRSIEATRAAVQSEHDRLAHERRLQTAARVVEASTRRIQDLKDRREIRIVEMRYEQDQQVEAAKRRENEDRLRLTKEQEREERLKKQREQARRKREDDKEKKKHDEEARKQRSERDRAARLAEQERRAGLTPDERDAEDRAHSERFAQQEAELAAQLIADGLEPRAARLKRKSMAEFDNDMDDDEDQDGSFVGESTRSKRIRTNGGVSRSDYDQPPIMPPLPMVEEYAYPLSISDEEFEDGEDDQPSVGTMRKWKQVEQLEKMVWSQIAKRDIPKVVKVYQQSSSSRQFFSKRVSNLVVREAKKAAGRTKHVKDITNRPRKVMRELMVFMKGNEKKERESRKKAEKEALEKARKEEEKREAQRQARKLNFLITQTELYSHFIGSKIKTKDAEESTDTMADKPPPQEEQKSDLFLKAIALGENSATNNQLKDLNFDEEDDTNAVMHARKNAQAAIDAAKTAAAAFDADAQANNGATENIPEMDFQNPTAIGNLEVAQPKLLTCTLKEYQLKGLNWLANLYEQGINGILADEMGLGKTVQSISLMAYLAEVHNIWGPFLVIAPSSTLHNWQQEITRFVPAFKALPYWGGSKERATLRKIWSRKSMRFDRDSPYHVLITSYQLAVQDEKYLQNVKWQYMVLDEAQAIKSSTSARWKTLLSFRCRNRLLLTGTPIQNSMHELWALLHFIMPSLFDSHAEFSEWFSKDIENGTDKSGAMNDHQLRRLHMILKPFMLRRVKKNVQNELGDKIEIDLFCDLTPRQKIMYRALRQHISLAELVARASSLQHDDDSVKRLMNLIMQFRKVCSHPELFERADVTAPFSFASFNPVNTLVRDPDRLEVPYATQSAIQLSIPKIVYREGLLTTVDDKSSAGINYKLFQNIFSIWNANSVYTSLNAGACAFSFMSLQSSSPSEVERSAKSSNLLSIGLGNEERKSLNRGYDRVSLLDDMVGTRFNIFPTRQHLGFEHRWRMLGLTPLDEVELMYRQTSPLTKSDTRFFKDSVIAPPVTMTCSDRAFVVDQELVMFDRRVRDVLYGLPLDHQNSLQAIRRFESAYPGFAPEGVISASAPTQFPFPAMQVPQLQKLILDSGKLARLDKLLPELKANGHRVLIYFQMTKMIDLMEEYLSFRQYKYLRLDGSSTMAERRDMVSDWQSKPELFIFLLSTRAGGLGINLTAADTVVFYDSDWNPSNDSQAMDRAHRMGQTKQVTVYRLITKDTVDERIVQLARTKKLVQDAVVGSSTITQGDPNTARPQEVMSLLLSPEELEESLRKSEEKRKLAESKASEFGKKMVNKKKESKKKPEPGLGLGMGSSWADDDEEGMSFFSSKPMKNEDDDEASSAPKKRAPKKKKETSDPQNMERPPKKPKTEKAKVEKPKTDKPKKPRGKAKAVDA